jgi:hypothetical protein
MAAVALTLGAVPLAAGRDLSAGVFSRTRSPEGTPATAINRAAKSDRAANMAGSLVPMRTISLRPSGLSDTSVLIRVPVSEAARSNSSVRHLIKPGHGKAVVACEPMVSVLTEVAKLLQPGRCVT